MRYDGAGRYGAQSTRCFVLAMAGRVFLTGISGFTGPYIARELQQQGYEVYGLGEGGSLEAVKLYTVDLRDLASITQVIAEVKPDFVIHLAAIAFVGHGDVMDMYGSNIVGTHNLLSALVASDCQPRRVLLASSANIYGNCNVEVLDETCPPNPVNDYAVSKYAMELMSRQWRDRLPVVIVRPFNYTGVGQSEAFLIPKIVAHFVHRKAMIELGNIDIYRDFSDVRDVAAAYVSLLNKGQNGAVYNVCSGRLQSLKDILHALSDIAGYSIDVTVNPAFVRNNEIRRLRGSDSKLNDAIGIRDKKPLPETLQWMYRESSRL